MTKPWLDRFVGAHTLSETSAFRVVSAFDLPRDRRVVVILATPDAEPSLAARALDRVYAAHRDPPHPGIAPAVERVAEAAADYVVLDFPACIDLGGLVPLAAEVGLRCTYEAADGFTASLREALLASAERRHPETGEPLCIGTFALSNVLFSAAGEHALIGYGHNVVCHDERGRLVPRGRFYQAPEIIAGAPPTAASDFVGLLRMSRTVVPFVSVPDAVLRILRGAAEPADRELGRLLMRFENEAIQAAPDARLPVPEILALSQRIREALGSWLDAAGFRDTVARLLAERRPELTSARSTLRLARDLRWFALDGDRSPLTRLQGRLLGALARARLDRPGAVVAADELFVACWPGERMALASARNRLYVAVSNLRRAGLGEVLESVDGGYRIGPGVRVEHVDP